MNLRNLKYLVAVAKHSHFGNAAKECYVSQPALSMQLQKLEDELGVNLFERTNKSVMITQVGQKIVELAKVILDNENQIKDIATFYTNPFAGDLKLGSFPTLAPYFFPKIMDNISEKYPNLRIYLVEEKTETLIDKLKNGEIDAAFLAYPLPTSENSLEYKELFDDEFFLAVSHQHPFSKFNDISQLQLKDKSLMLLEDGHCLRDQALEVCTLSGAKENDKFKASSLETLRQMVANNLGITLIPKIALDENKSLKYIKFKDNPPKRKIALFWRKTSARKSMFKDFI